MASAVRGPGSSFPSVKPLSLPHWGGLYGRPLFAWRRRQAPLFVFPTRSNPRVTAFHLTARSFLHLDVRKK
jgi:hypothetical protein